MWLQVVGVEAQDILASGIVINDDKGSLGSPTTSWLLGQRHAMLFVGLEMLKSELAKT